MLKDRLKAREVAIDLFVAAEDEDLRELGSYLDEIAKPYRDYLGGNYEYLLYTINESEFGHYYYDDNYRDEGIFVCGNTENRELLSVGEALEAIRCEETDPMSFLDSDAFLLKVLGG